MGKEENIETESELRENAKNKDWRVRVLVADNKNTPFEVLVALAKDEDWIVRAGVAGNESTPPEVLAELAEDEDTDVREMAARNESTPPEVLQELSQDKCWKVRWAIAKNINTPVDIPKSFHLFNWLINGFVVGIVVVAFSFAVLFCWKIAGWLMLIY